MTAEERRQYQRKWRRANPAKMRGYWERWAANNPAYQPPKEDRQKHTERIRKQRQRNPAPYRAAKRAYDARNPEKVGAYRRTYYQANKEKTIAAALKWFRDNPDRKAITDWLRYRRTRQATPRWVDRKALRAIKQACPPGYHVDHIVPLHGVTIEGWLVCGLNVPWNLQYLTPSQNCSKKNRVISGH